MAIGGSRDQSYPNASSMLSSFPKKVGIVNIDSHFDIRPIIEGKVKSANPFRFILEDQRFLPKEGRFVEFGVKGSTNANAHF